MGKRSLLNFSDACKGRSAGKWSIETRSSRLVPALEKAHLANLSNACNQMIRDHLRDRYFKGGSFECRIKLVNRERVEGAEIVTADVYDDRKPSRVTCLLQYRKRNER